MPRFVPFALVMLLASPGTPGATSIDSSNGNPSEFFAPTTRISPDDWRELRAGRMIVRTVPGGGPHHTAVFVAVRLAARPDRFAARVRRSAELWRGPKVPASGTFSHPVQPQDVQELFLRSDDLRSLRSCRPGSCDVKLGAREMERLRTTLLNDADPHGAAVLREFRGVVLDRMRDYRREGMRGLPHIHDHRAPVDLQETFSRVLHSAPFLMQNAPGLAEYIDHYPAVPLPPGSDEFGYWLETSETPRPTIQALHVVIQRRPPPDPVEVVVVSRQVFATHYVNGSLAVTALLRDPLDPSQRYLAYLNVSATDGLGGLLSGLRRFVIERRIRGAARTAFELFRSRIEQ